MANFTVLNPKEAESQIDDFWCQATRLGQDFYRAATEFYVTLFNYWCSPKAEEFGNMHLRDLMFIWIKIDNMANEIGDKATLAYNAIASANGLPGIDTTGLGEYITEPEGSFKLYSSFEDGSVGMDHKVVQKCIDYIEEKRKVLVDGLNNLPLDIAFFDPDDAQKTAYRGIITKTIETINGIVDDVIGTLKSALETEIQVVIASSQSASEELKG